MDFSIPLSPFLFLSVPISFPLSLCIYTVYTLYVKNITHMIFINTMNPVTIAYHFFKKVQQKYNLREENLLTDTENKKVN